MQTHKRTRVELIIEKRRLERLLALIDAEPGIHGYTVMPCLGGRGQEGERLPDPLSNALSAVLVMVITQEAPARRLLEAAVEAMGEHIGVATIGEVEVLRGERF